MTTIKLYTGGGVSLSPVNAEGRTESEYVRLVADDGMMLVNGGLFSTAADVNKADVGAWQEVPYVEPDGEPAIEDKAEAYDILMGKEESE